MSKEEGILMEELFDDANVNILIGVAVLVLILISLSTESHPIKWVTSILGLIGVGVLLKRIFFSNSNRSVEKYSQKFSNLRH